MMYTIKKLLAEAADQLVKSSNNLQVDLKIV